MLPVALFRNESGVRAVSEVEEKGGKLWMGSVLMPFVAVYNLASGECATMSCSCSSFSLLVFIFFTQGISCLIIVLAAVSKRYTTNIAKAIHRRVLVLFCQFV